MVEPHNPAGDRINPSDIGSFMIIASKTSEAGIAGRSGTAMLLSNDVIDLMRQRAIILRKLAILASIPRPASNQVS